MDDKLVPDTSVIIEGLLSKRIGGGELRPKQVLIHEAVMAELESQANKGRETGFLGLEEIKKIRELSGTKFELVFKGNRPTDFEIKYAKTGEIDSIIRQLASDEKATLVTADKVQALVAESKGIAVILYEFAEQVKPFALESFFSENIMSVHIKENCPVMAKKGKPGSWEFVEVSAPLDRDGVKELAKHIAEDASSRPDAFIESDRKGSTVMQIGNTRVLVTRPPFSDGYEITAVRPVKKLSLEDYDLPQKVLARISVRAEGILIAGAPGQGKSTFAQALAEHYLSKRKVIKTIESPRDLILPPEVTQYSFSHGNSQEISDAILLSRPDHVIFDEMRSTEDFRLFSDLRLSGVGMVGVVHATQAVDAIQRFIGRIELGVIPHVVDTVIFINEGKVERVLSINLEVKVPSGMLEQDLSRPTVTVHDFNSGRLEYEIYTYGEQAVVVPVIPGKSSPVSALAEQAIQKEVERAVEGAKVEVTSANSCTVTVPSGMKIELVGKGGYKIVELEEKLGMRIDVVEEARKRSTGETLNYQADFDKKNILFMLSPAEAMREVDIHLDGEFLISATASKKGVISLSLSNRVGRLLFQAVKEGRPVVISGK